MADFEAPNSAPQSGGDALDGKFWNISLRMYGGHNDNVDFVGNVDPFFMGSTDSDYIGFTGIGSVRIPVTSYITVGGALRIDRNHHFGTQRVPIPAANENQDEYDVSAAQPSAFAETMFVIGGRQGRVGINYNLRFEDGEITALGSTAHTLGLYADLYYDAYTDFGVKASRTWTDFEVAFPAPALDDRDSTFTSFGFSGTRWFSGHQRSLTGSVSFNRNDAFGMNFDYHGVTVSGAFMTRIYGPVSASLNVSHDMRHYPGFVSGFIPAPGRESQTITTYGLQVNWVICPGWVLDGFFNYATYDSNMPQFEGDNKNVGMGLTRTF